MDSERSLARDVAALLVIIIACPSALFGGALLGCVAEGFTAACALNGIMISPFMLGAAGIIAGLLSRGWSGLGIAALGVILGMIGVLVLSALLGTLVPIDPVQGTIAWIWFMTPVVVGYGVGRAIGRLVAGRRPARAR